MDLLVYSPAFEMLGIIDSFTSFRWRRRYHDPGEFELHCAATADNVAMLRQGNIIHRVDRREAGIIEGIGISGTENGDTLTITGRMGSSLLDRRCIYPVLNFNGTAENAMRKIVNDNCITGRPIDRLRLGAMNGYAETCSFQATGKNVLTTQSALSRSSGIGVIVRFDVESKVWRWETYKGIDRTVTQSDRPYVLFSDEFGNIKSPEYTYNEQNYKNYAYVAGAGEGVARVIIQIDQTGGKSRRELWVDARDLQPGNLTMAEYQAQLRQRGLEKMAETRIVENFEAAAVDTANFEYLLDWDLGDVVSFQKWGLLLNQRITEVEEVYEDGVTTITPVCGTPLPETLNLGDDA